MKETIQHSVYGEITYSESFWLGKKALTVNGAVAQPIGKSKKEFMVNGEKAILKGSAFTGVTMLIGNETVELIRKPKVYEIILAILPIVFLLTWGNSVALCSIFPVVGGAIGGAIGAIFACESMMLMRKAKTPLTKILIGFGMFAATLLVGFIVAILLISLMG
jgi:hypothetical protein